MLLLQLAVAAACRLQLLLQLLQACRNCSDLLLLSLHLLHCPQCGGPHTCQLPTCLLQLHIGLCHLLLHTAQLRQRLINIEVKLIKLDALLSLNGVAGCTCLHACCCWKVAKQCWACCSWTQVSPYCCRRCGCSPSQLLLQLCDLRLL
ncbi:hypothetical protein COO60DRAFT_1524450 [Scenedesmus sp. NREL 46B-D3]|nr:hypothetical protein COO60DRAFT_1524450 [Scenedesmus sp. NREL 46B-D3]